jgi:hypothetical protein
MRSFITLFFAKNNRNNRVKEGEMGKACSTHGDNRNAYRVLVGRPEGKRPLGRPRCRWDDHVKMNLREVGWSGMDSIRLAQDRDQWWALVITVVNLWVP